VLLAVKGRSRIRNSNGGYDLGYFFGRTDGAPHTVFAPLEPAHPAASHVGDHAGLLRRRLADDIGEQRGAILWVGDAGEGHRIARDHRTRLLEPAVQGLEIPSQVGRPQRARIVEVLGRGALAAQQPGEVGTDLVQLVGLQFVAGPALDVEQLAPLEIRRLDGRRLPENGDGLERDEGYEDDPLGLFDHLFDPNDVGGLGNSNGIRCLDHLTLAGLW